MRHPDGRLIRTDVATLKKAATDPDSDFRAIYLRLVEMAEEELDWGRLESVSRCSGHTSAQMVNRAYEGDIPCANRDPIPYGNIRVVGSSRCGA